MNKEKELNDMFKEARKEQIKMANDHMDKIPTSEEILAVLERLEEE
jgi:hypothetical protein